MGRLLLFSRGVGSVGGRRVIGRRLEGGRRAGENTGYGNSRKNVAAITAPANMP